jgi:hypothetical protein
MEREDLITLLKATRVVFEKPRMIFDSIEDMIDMHSYPEEIKDSFLFKQVRNVEDAFRLSIEQWLYITMWLNANPSEDNLKSAQELATVKDGLCKYAGNITPGDICKSCPIGKEEDICFREVDAFLKGQGRAIDVLRRLVTEYEKHFNIKL